MKGYSLKMVAPVLMLALSASTNEVPAQDNFYQGKTVRIIVGTIPGGGFDLYSRTIAPHLGKHIPGHPKVAVENSPVGKRRS